MNDNEVTGATTPNVLLRRRTRTAISARGAIAPVVATRVSADIARAFGQTGGGWLHVDGAAVSMGTLDGTAPLRAVASVRGLVDRLSATRAVMEHLRNSKMERYRAGDIADGTDPDDFEEEEISEQVYPAYPVPDEAMELSAVGWYQVKVRPIGVRMVVECCFGGDAPMVIRREVENIAEMLGFPASGVRPYEGSARGLHDDLDEGPDPDDFADFDAASFAGMPGFGGYDAETRIVSFNDRDATVTLPGGLGWTPPEGRDEYAYGR